MNKFKSFTDDFFFFCCTICFNRYIIFFFKCSFVYYKEINGEKKKKRMSKILRFGTFCFFLLSLLFVSALAAASSSSELHSSALRRHRNRRQQSPLRSLTTTTTTTTTPQQQCGWPYMTENLHHDFGPWTVKQLQYTLAGHLNEPSFKIDGVYGPETAALVRRFQTAAKISVDGATGPQTWGAIQSAVYPVKYGASGEVVSAIQEALTFQGFPTNVTGVFDGMTVMSLRNFQIARKDTSSNQNGQVATAATFHLLGTGCNSGGHFWFDAGWPQGILSTETLSCLREQGKFDFVTFECWVEASPTGEFWSECKDNINNAYKAGFTNVGIYMFAQRYNTDTTSQVRQLLGNLSGTNFTNIMLDIEGDKWSQYTHEENQQFILGLKSAFNEMGHDNLVVYCGSEWPDFFGANFTAFSKYPVVYAHYDDIPSFVDFWPSYGGWNAPAGKQFWDGSSGEVICGTGAIDWDWSAKPFWGNNNKN